MRLIAALFLLSLSAQAGTVSRLYDFEPGTKAQADQVDAELDNIISTINGNIDTSNLSTGAIDTPNIANSAITTAKLADGAVTNAKLVTGSTAYLTNYRKGCALESSQVAAVTQSVNVKAPCALIVDGVKGSIVVDTAVSALDTGTFANKTAYYVYGKPTLAGALTFEISATTPNVGTFRKASDSTKRYVGSLMTGATANIGSFKQNGNKYHYNTADVQPAGTFPSATISSAVTGGNVFSQNVNVPSFATAIFADYAAIFGGTQTYGSDYCNTIFYSRDTISRVNEMRKHTANGFSYQSDFRIPISSKNLEYYNSCTLNIATFTSLNFTIYGWEEPAELY
jgi:hypothetical protein